MSVALAVLIVAVVAAVATAAWSMWRHGPGGPVDPAAPERWIVQRVRHRPRLAAFIRRRLDTASAGGLLLTVSFAVVFGTALLVGAVLDLADSNGTVAALDESVSEWGAEHATSTTVDVVEVVTDLGGTPVVAVVLLVVGAVDYAVRRNGAVVLFLLTVGVGQVLLTNGLKLIIDRERPSVLHLVGASGSSFPSGHSATAAACWAAVALVIARSWSRRGRALAGAAAAFVAIAVAASRALLGVHWLTDVVAGVLLGWGWFTVVTIGFGGRIMRLGEPAARVGAPDARDHTSVEALTSPRAARS